MSVFPDNLIGAATCLIVGHDWIDRGRYLVCGDCGVVKRIGGDR